VLLVVLVTGLQVAGPRAGSPGHVPELLAGLAGTVLGAAAALIGGVALLWRRSRPVGVLAVCIAWYAVNAAVIPGVPYQALRSRSASSGRSATVAFATRMSMFPSSRGRSGSVPRRRPGGQVHLEDRGSHPVTQGVVHRSVRELGVAGVGDWDVITCAGQVGNQCATDASEPSVTRATRPTSGPSPASACLGR
jgi:hypothetical protein